MFDEKTFVPNKVDEGILICKSDKHGLKDLSPIFFTDEGIVTLYNEEH